MGSVTDVDSCVPLMDWRDRCLLGVPYPDGRTYLYWDFRDVLCNTPYRPTRKTITDCGFAMFPLPNMGPNSGLADVTKQQVFAAHCITWF